MTVNDPKPSPRPSPLARYLLLAYVLLIVYGSLYPFSGWRDQGVSPFAYLSERLPRYITAFDVLTNLLAYMPLGFLALLALYPHMRGKLAFAAASLAGCALSLAMEALQTYLPSRYSSNLDLATNSLGAFVGAGLALGFGVACSAAAGCTNCAIAGFTTATSTTWVWWCSGCGCSPSSIRGPCCSATAICAAC